VGYINVLLMNLGSVYSIHYYMAILDGRDPSLMVRSHSARAQCYINTVMGTGVC